MTRRKSLAFEISEIMPVIARRVVLGFFQKNDIPQTQILTIMALDKMEGCRLLELSQSLKVSAPTATGIVDRLERSGYALRSEDENDRRAVCISLTSKGKNMAKKFQAFITQRWETILVDISKEDQQKFLDILMKIQNNSS